MFHFREALAHNHRYNYRIKKQDEELEVPDLILNPAIADEEPNNPAWKKLHEIADNNQSEVERVFTNAAESLKESTVLADLSEAIRNEKVGQAQAQIPWQVYEENLEELSSVYTRTVEVAGKAMIIHLPPNYRGFEFNINNPNIVKYINEKTGELIKYLSQTSKEATNKIILDTYLRGYHPDKAARQIKSLLALTERQSKAVDNYVANAIEQGFSESKAFERGQQYAEKLLEYRAENIARTEIMEAVNRGYHETINQGIERGIIPPTKTTKKWIVTPDDRLCEICRPLGGQERNLDGLFDGQYLTPPRHPRCRCSLSYEIRD